MSLVEDNSGFGWFNAWFLLVLFDILTFPVDVP